MILVLTIILFGFQGCCSEQTGEFRTGYPLRLRYAPLVSSSFVDLFFSCNSFQMLDGREDSLEVSASSLSHSSTQSGTLDSFLKRCHTAIDGGSSSGSPKSKCPKI